MAIFIQNITRCPLCGLIIEADAEAIAFPAMVWNELDPLWPISDAVVHTSCLSSCGMLRAAESRQRAVHLATGPGKRPCKICGNQVISPDDHLAVGYLTDEKTSPLYPFNLAQFHISCLEGWPELPSLISDLKVFNSSGGWQGNWLTTLITRLNATTLDTPPTNPHG